MQYFNMLQGVYRGGQGVKCPPRPVKDSELSHFLNLKLKSEEHEKK